MLMIVWNMHSPESHRAFLFASLGGCSFYSSLKKIKIKNNNNNNKKPNNKTWGLKPVFLLLKRKIVT